MTASETATWQVHASVNTDHGDSALRVTITFYDETGHSVLHRTWRKHVKALSYEGADWQAYSAAVDLAKMLGEVCGAGLELVPDQPDSPLPGL